MEKTEIDRAALNREQLLQTLIRVGLVLFLAPLVVWFLWPLTRILRDPVSAFNAAPDIKHATATYIRGILDDDVEVRCVVANDGATGDVTVYGVLQSGSEHWIQSQKVRVQHKGTAELRFLFTEFRKGEAKFGVTFSDGMTRDPRILRPIP